MTLQSQIEQSLLITLGFSYWISHLPSLNKTF